MLKKKAFNRIFFTTVVFFIVFMLYSFNLVNNKSYKKEYKNNAIETLYTINEDNYISETPVYVGKLFTLEDRIKEKLEIMTKENNKNALLPSYFNPILPENTKVLDVKINDGIVKVYFSKELENINHDQAESMIEAIIYTITNEQIYGIEIYVENNLLKYVPHTNKELPAILTKDFGINKDYNLSSLSDINKVIINYFKECNNDYCSIPVTKYLNDEREKLEIVFEQLSKTRKENDLISLIENININKYSITEKEITIDIDKDITEEESDLIALSLFDNYKVNKITIFVNGNKKIEKIRKILENNK